MCHGIDGEIETVINGYTEIETLNLDCLDGSDENSCFHPPCLPQQFRCTSGQCVSKYKRCDGDTDCKDGSDEMRCTSQLCQGFLCNSGDCISSQLYQDGAVDCSGNLEEDELDGRSDCPNSEDERNCKTLSCPGMFKCGQENRCIPQSEEPITSIKEFIS
ncbi:CD320 antigen-like [Tubulanus polymorphus]|uniref:CD320 antigen-like n=1 Tax=Tubulanus polymorphus TaxID=672921 RepID=UPI003DA57B76